MAGLSLRKGFAWTLAGTITYSLGQWLLVVVLARLANPEVVGQFALILAICTPIYLMIGLNLRVVLATDARRRWALADYLRTRKVLAAISLAFSLAVGWALGIRGEVFVSLFVIGLAKASESYGLTLYGYFQLNKRLDIAARSMMSRGVLGSAGFALGYTLSDALAVASVGLLLGWQSTLWAWDIPNAKRLAAGDTVGILQNAPAWDWRTIRAISRKALPLGIDAGLRSLALGLPRIAIFFYLGSSPLGVYTALASFALVPTLITGSLGAGAIPTLAQFYLDGSRARFVHLYVRVLAIAGGVSVSFAGAAYLVGGHTIRTLLGVAYDDQALLMALVVAYGVAVFQGVLSQGLQAANWFKVIATADALALGVVAALSVLLVPKYGVVAAAAALGIAMAISSLLLVIAAGRMIRGMPASGAGSDHKFTEG